ncbi:hypothetical protein LUZ63_015169 [Rhynchospora breviuscula]|uniref:Uncharacterized protein n=1 Tax=Rhynchospora breviuscula TaxID=2022672 RepID=A0A9Q0CBS3_9POAL|nr:hypothetical protein LUZ63_015169 [Rhynchospora breviuscula]
MEATAVGFAKTMVDGVLQKVATRAADELAKTLGVRQDIWYIRGELEMMQGFLRAAEAPQDDNNVRLIWVRQVRDLAYQIEDCLAEFSIHLENRSLWHKLQTLNTRRRIASNIRDIREKVQEVSQRNLRYNLIKPVKPSHDSTSNYVDVTTRMTTLVMEEAELVGQAELKRKLFTILTEKEELRKVVWITGMGGLGKTTLAKKVFDSLETKFTCRAWLTISQTFNMKDLLMEIFKQISEDKYEKIIKKEEEMKTDKDRIDYVKNKLQENAYLLVLDDLWTTQAWDIIEKTFLINNEKGSCVMVTTRNVDVATHCSWTFKKICPVEPLSDEHSRELLLRKIYKGNEVPNTHRDLNDVTEKIIKKCGGLPLAIVTIGGLLTSKPINKEEWEKLLNRLGSELEKNPNAEAAKQILDLSYYDLPYYLKPCIVYLSIFPEDFEIKCSRLVHRWMAEGFVRERRGMTPEEVAEEYFYELINRNLILPSVVGVNGRIKSCRVHDIMHELLVAKSIEENLIFITGEQENMTPISSIRHLIITRSNEMTSTNLHGIRSISIFDADVPSIFSSSSKLKLLKVLDLSNLTRPSGYFKHAMRHLGQFEHLKYISFPRNTDFNLDLPKSIGKLRDLQTLDACMETAPNDITKLQRLRHFYSYNYVAMPEGIGNLKELQVLKWIDIERSHPRVVKELGQLRQLRKLGVANLRIKHYKELSESISQLSSLRSLVIRKLHNEVRRFESEYYQEAPADFLDSVMSSPPEHLRSIEFQGVIGKLPAWVSSLSYLAKVTLWDARLNDDGIVVLQELPNLLLLRLRTSSYVGVKLIFRSSKFPKLKELFVYNLENLGELLFEEGTLPELQTLKISYCNCGISGIQYLSKLKKLTLDSSVIVENLDEVQKQLEKHPNHPALELGS